MDKRRIQLKKADIVLTRTNSLMGRLIRIGSTSIGESGTRVNHVGLIVDDEQLVFSEIVEAVTHGVKQSYLWGEYKNPKSSISIFRPKNLTEQEIESICEYAKKQIGKHYGFVKIGLHFLDWCLLGAYAFRRMANSENYPICSWLVAYAYSSVDKHFGVTPNQASPDDIWDFVSEKSDIYECILELDKI